MTEPTIVCPQCKTEIKLTESLAAPLGESTRRDYEQRLAKKDADIASRESSLREREEALTKAKDTIDDQVAEKVRQETRQDRRGGSQESQISAGERSGSEEQGACRSASAETTGRETRRGAEGTG